MLLWVVNVVSGSYGWHIDLNDAFLLAHMACLVYTDIYFVCKKNLFKNNFVDN